MRILMTTDCVGGVFVYALELTREVIARGHEVVLAVMGPPLRAEQRAELETLPRAQLEVRERVCALEWMDEPWDELERTGAWLLDLADATLPDCVHLNEFAFGALGFRAPVLMVGHSCVLSWWQAVHGQPAPARYDRYRALVRWGLQAADCVVAPSQSFLRSLSAYYGPLRDARAIPNGVRLDDFAPRGKAQRVLCAGRLWDSAKNLYSVRRAAAELSWPVYIAGQLSGPEGQRVDPAPCRALGSLARSELAEQLAISAIYAAPARYEPFGLSVLEAAASGCALVLGRIPSLLEHWSDAALFVDPNDVHELARTLDGLIADPERRTALGQRARLRSRAFPVATMAESYLGLYRELRHAQPARGARPAKEPFPCAS